MGFFKLGTMTLGGMFKKPETLKYPFETKEPYAGQKGTIKQTGVTTCNLCGICEKRCPCRAIKVDRDKKTWSIEHFQCLQCGYCVMGCPKKCLVMDGAKPEVVAKKKAEVVKIKLPDKKPADKKVPEKKE
ncbi:MAG: 4Fe-4S ferredoxin [Alphaproteobacteria bacterium]|nr:4Fe-4S ferredoxin [Alphaproteobacteria bacterium]